MHIIIDTREQNPWHFGELAEVSRGTIRQGDYCLAGDPDQFSVERKSLDDFIGTISSGWERFRRELDRMKATGMARIIIVEGDLESCCFRKTEAGQIVKPEHNHYKIQPAFVFLRIAEMSYSGVSVIFAGGRDYAAYLCWRILKLREEELSGVEVRL